LEKENEGIFYFINLLNLSSSFFQFLKQKINKLEKQHKMDEKY
jgi:hypothetical protein